LPYFIAAVFGGCAFGQRLLDGLAQGTPGVSLLSYL